MSSVGLLLRTWVSVLVTFILAIWISLPIIWFTAPAISTPCLEVTALADPGTGICKGVCTFTSPCNILSRLTTMSSVGPLLRTWVSVLVTFILAISVGLTITWFPAPAISTPCLEVTALADLDSGICKGVCTFTSPCDILSPTTMSSVRLLLRTWFSVLLTIIICLNVTALVYSFTTF